MKNNLLEIRTKRGFTNRAKFAEMLNMTPQNLHNIEVKGQNITPEVQEKICNILNCDRDDLYKDNLDLNILEEKDDKIYYVKYFPEIKASAGCGFLTGNEFAEKLGLTSSFIRQIGIINIENISIIRVVGNSMEPTLKTNDYLFVDTSKKDIYNNKIYVIKEDNSLKVKRIKKDNPFAKEVTIISDNQIEGEYPPYSLKIDDMDKNFICGQVIFYCRSIE